MSPELGLRMAGGPAQEVAYVLAGMPQSGGTSRFESRASNSRRVMGMACRCRRIEVRVTTANAGQAGTLVTAAMARCQ